MNPKAMRRQHQCTTMTTCTRCCSRQSCPQAAITKKKKTALVLLFLAICAIVTGPVSCTIIRHQSPPPTQQQIQSTASVTIKLAQLYPYGDEDPSWRKEYMASRDAHQLGFQHAFADGFLPGVQLSIVDVDTTQNGTRADEGSSVFAALDVVKLGVVGILGGGSSGSAAQISLVTRSMKIPVCSMVAGSSILSNKLEHPYFYRYIATSITQAKATLDLMLYANWSQFSLIQEGGNPFVQSYASEFAELARQANLTMLSSTVVWQDNELINKTIPRLSQQLNDTQAPLVYAHWTSETAKVIAGLHKEGWFRDAPPGRPRVIILVNYLDSDMIELDPVMARDVLTQAALIRLIPIAFNFTKVYTNFLEDYQARNDKEYPYGTRLDNFKEAYACAYSMVAGLHRLKQITPNVTYEDIAARSSTAFGNLTLDIFNVTDERKPQKSKTTTHEQVTLLLDSNGDPVADHVDVMVVKPIFNLDGSILSSGEVLLVTLSQTTASSDPAKSEYRFPGLPPGVFPRDRDPDVDIQWTHPEGIATAVVFSVLTCLVLVSFGVLVHYRTHIVVRKSSLSALGVVHLGVFILFINAVLQIGIPDMPTCAAKSVSASIGLGLFLLAGSVRLFMIWRVTSLRQVVQVQKILASQKQQITQAASLMTRRVSRSVAKAVPMVVKASHSPKSGAVRSNPAPAGAASANTAASPKKLAQETEARLQHEALVEVLDGRRPDRMVAYLFSYGGPLLVVYTAATIYYFAICELQVKRVLITTLSRYEHRCECISPALNLYSWMFMLLTHLTVFAFNIMVGWSQRHIAYNVYEARRTALATFNGVLGTVVYVALQVLGSSYSLRMFYVVLLLFVAFSSFAIYVGPLFMRIHATSGARAGSHDARQVDSNESLSTNRSQSASSASSGGRPGSRPSRVLEGSTRERSLIASGPQEQLQSAGIDCAGSSTATLDPPALPSMHTSPRSSGIPRDPSVLSPSMIDGSTPEEGGMYAANDVPVFVRVFTAHARLRLPDPIVRQQSSGTGGASRVDRCVLGLQRSRALHTLFMGGGKNGVVWERYRWTRVELWCLFSSEPGMGCLQIHVEGQKLDAQTLGGPLSAFHTVPITDPSVVPNPCVSKSTTVGRPSGNPGAAANPPIFPSSRRTTSAAPALASNSPSPFLVLHGTCSHVWMLLQFPHARHARRFAGLFAPPKAMGTDTGQGQSDQIAQAAAGLMSVF